MYMYISVFLAVGGGRDGSVGDGFIDLHPRCVPLICCSGIPRLVGVRASSAKAQMICFGEIWFRIATHYNALQHTAAHCFTLQHITTHCYTLQRSTARTVARTVARTATHTATHGNTLQHTATFCNIPRHPCCCLSEPCCSVLQCVAVCCSVSCSACCELRPHTHTKACHK